MAGANDEIDMEACNAGGRHHLPVHPGRRRLRRLLLVRHRDDLDAADVHRLDRHATVSVLRGRATRRVWRIAGSIGTIPWYGENGLVSDGDPAVAFGPKPGPGGFSWANGSRLYYANLTSNVGATRSEQAFKGFEAIAVSRTDNVQAAAAGVKSAWCVGAAGCAPVIVSKQSSTTFSDKEQVWADNAASSPFFGTVYLCWASFRGQEKGNAAPAPLIVAVSHDGGDTWT